MATIRLFDRLGNRDNMARNRMRYLVNEIGWEKFQKMVLKERTIVEMTISEFTKTFIKFTLIIHMFQQISQQNSINSLLWKQIFLLLVMVTIGGCIRM